MTVRCSAWASTTLRQCFRRAGKEHERDGYAYCWQHVKKHRKGRVLTELTVSAIQNGGRFSMGALQSGAGPTRFFVYEVTKE